MHADGGRPLSPEDLAILALENETVAGHTCKVIVLRDPLDPARLRSSIAGRLHRAPLLSMRLGEAGGAPWWVPDPQLDLAAHVVEASPAGAADDAGFRTAVAGIFEQHLDRSRPLWRIDVIPRLPGGGSALTWRIHHALADGSTAMQMARAVLWDDPPGDQAADPPGTQAGPAARPRGAPAASPAGRARGGLGPAGRHRLEGLRAAVRETPQPAGPPSTTRC